MTAVVAGSESLDTEGVQPIPRGRDSVVVRRIDRKEIGEAADTLAWSFVDEPSLSHVLGGTPRRRLRVFRARPSWLAVALAEQPSAPGSNSGSSSCPRSASPSDTPRSRTCSALTATNTGYVEWELDQSDRYGKRYHGSGITKFRVEGGKIRHGKDYIFDQVVTATAYPHKEPAVA